MRSTFFGWLAIGLLGSAAFAACVNSGSDESTDEGDTNNGSGATGGDSSGTAGSGNGSGAGNPGNCTEIANIGDFNASPLYAMTWEGTPEPALAGADPDYFELDVPAPGSSFTLPALITDCFETMPCVIVYEDVGEETTGAYYVSESGSLAVDSQTGDYYITGSMDGVKLVEVTTNEETGAVTATPNGRCLYVPSFAFVVEPPTAGWECPPTYYDEAGQGDETPDCDCNCGALDADCSDVANPILGCEEGQTCGASATCEGVPTAWTCADSEYGGGASNGCDCNCGTYDPDCDLPTEAVQGCPANSVCTTGTCVPSAWECDPAYYNIGDPEDCDCGCNAPDPDCTDLLAGTCNYCNDTGSCNTGMGCPGTINATNNAVCN